MSKLDEKTRIYLIDPVNDRALISSFYTDDGLFDGAEYDEWLQMQENGDRTPVDYADYEVETGDCY